MPTLEHDRLVFRFPQIEAEASFSINFQRTLRIPDTETTYALPPGFGLFCCAMSRITLQTCRFRRPHGEVSFCPCGRPKRMPVKLSKNQGPHWGLDFPVAIKVAAGKINAVTGGSLEVRAAS